MNTEIETSIKKCMVTVIVHDFNGGRGFFGEPFTYHLIDRKEFSIEMIKDAPSDYIGQEVKRLLNDVHQKLNKP